MDRQRIYTTPDVVEDSGESVRLGDSHEVLRSRDIRYIGDVNRMREHFNNRIDMVHTKLEHLSEELHAAMEQQRQSSDKNNPKFIYALSKTNHELWLKAGELFGVLLEERKVDTAEAVRVTELGSKEQELKELKDLVQKREDKDKKVDEKLARIVIFALLTVFAAFCILCCKAIKVLFQLPQCRIM